MNRELLEEFVNRCRGLRSDFLSDVYQEQLPIYKRLFTKAVDPSSKSVLGKEYDFYIKVMEEMEGLEKLRGLVSSKQELDEAIVFLKNHSERAQYTVDYLSFFHGILAFLIAMGAILAKLFGSQNWGIVIISAIFIFKVFSDRASKRLEIAMNKEIINCLEYKRGKMP